MTNTALTISLSVLSLQLLKVHGQKFTDRF